MSIFKGSERLEILGYEIVHLISIGEKEDVDTIIEKMNSGSLIPYLIEKHGSDFVSVTSSPESPYDINEWEKVLDEYGYMTFGHDVSRKMGIQNTNDGLLMLLSIILEEVSKRK